MCVWNWDHQTSCGEWGSLTRRLPGHVQPSLPWPLADGIHPHDTSILGVCSALLLVAVWLVSSSVDAFVHSTNAYCISWKYSLSWEEAHMQSY